MFNALLGHGWIHQNWCFPSTLHQKLMFFNGNSTETIYANPDVKYAKSCFIDVGIVGDELVPYWRNYSN